MRDLGVFRFWCVGWRVLEGLPHEHTHTNTHRHTHTKLWIVYTNKLYKLDGDRTVWSMEKASWFPKLLR